MPQVLGIEEQYCKSLASAYGQILNLGAEGVIHSNLSIVV